MSICITVAEHDNLTRRSQRLTEVEAELTCTREDLRAASTAQTERIARLQADLDAARNELTRTRDEFVAYKAKVRELAIETADNENWCAEGLNRGLRELGLEERTFTFEVRLDVTTHQSVYVNVTAIDEDDAHDKAGDLDREDYADQLAEADRDDTQIDQVYVVGRA